MKHPFYQFYYCPKCGSSDFYVHNEKSKKCSNCGFVYYFNPCAATVAFIENEQGELLVCKRAKDPAKGTLDLPGGFLDMFETAEMGIAREVMEETRLQVISAEYLFSLPNTYVYSNFEVHTLDLFFKCNVVDTTLFQAMDDAAELYFIPQDKIDPKLFGLHSISMGVERYLKSKKRHKADKQRGFHDLP